MDDVWGCSGRLAAFLDITRRNQNRRLDITRRNQNRRQESTLAGWLFP